MDTIAVMEIECYCLVADVLGFSSLIRNLEALDRADRVQSWLRLVATTLEEFELTRSSIISDTIFVGAEFSEEGLGALVSFARKILESGLASWLPVRGAITHGPVAWEDTLTYGPAIVSAYEFANKQNWTGISGTDDPLPHAQALFEPAGGLVTYTTPLKTGVVAYHPVVKWTIPSFEELMSLMSSKGLVHHGAFMDWALAEKLQNTFLFRSYLDILPPDWNGSRFYGGILPLHAVANARGFL